MAHQTSHPKILTDETMKEVAHHGNPEFPLGYYVEDIWEFDFHCVDWHWHPEVEVIYVLEGTATVLAGSGSYRLSAGTAAFLNSQVIHCFRSEGSTIVPNLVFSPEIIAPAQSLLYRKFIAPVLHSGMDIQVFSPETAEDRAVLHCLREVIAHQEQRSPSELRTVLLLMALWEAIGSRIEGSPETCSLRALAQLQRMMQYVHTHYAQKVTLEELAGEVSISKSSRISSTRRSPGSTPGGRKRRSGRSGGQGGAGGETACGGTGACRCPGSGFAADGCGLAGSRGSGGREHSGCGCSAGARSGSAGRGGSGTKVRWKVPSGVGV